MPIVSRTMRWPKSEDVLRQETLAKIDARKARTAVTTAKLVLTLISTHRCKPGPKSRCVRSDRAQLSRNDFCLRFWVYDARSRSKQECETGKRSENYAHGSSSKGYLSSTFIESIHLLVRYQKKSQRPKRRPWRGYQPHIPFKRDFSWGQGVEAFCQASRHPRPEAKCRYGSCSVQPGSKVTSADWIFYRISIERPDRSIPAPIATGTKVKTKSLSVKEAREF